MITMCTNTGTYLDVPFHRFADGQDLSDLSLERVAGVPAVLIQTGQARHWVHPLTSSTTRT